MKSKHSISKVVLITSVVISMKVVSAPLMFAMPKGEGGSLSGRAVESFEQYMAENSCPVKIDIANNAVQGDLYFSAVPKDLLVGSVGDYELLSQIKTYKDYPLTSAIVIKSSTGITDLASVKGERLSLISESSYLGGQRARQLYKDARVAIDERRVYLTERYEGAITLLLHGDVFVAAIPGPLATRWAKANNLSIIVESEPLDIGEVLINKTVSSDQKKLCKTAFKKIKRTTRRDKRMNVFPAWVEGFK